VQMHYGKQLGRHKKYAEVVVGNDHVKFDAWSGECYFNIKLGNHPQYGVGKNDRNVVGDTIRWEKAWGGYEIYNLNWGGDLEDDPQGIEWMMWLNAEPPTNSITLDIEHAGLSFYYQEPLPYADGTIDSQFIADTLVGTTHRAPELVESWAVYRSDGAKWNRVEVDANGDTVQTQIYNTGKAFHIYRPKAIDATDDTIWCSIAIDTAASTLTLSVDAGWLASASYPVVIDPIIGTNNEGASMLSYTNGTGFGCKTNNFAYIASSGDQVTDINWYGSCFNSDRELEYTIYTADGSAGMIPDECFYVDTMSACNGSPSSDTVWYSLTGLSVSLTADDTLQVCISKIAGDGNNSWYYDSGPVGGGSGDFTGLDKCPWTSQVSYNYEISMYATVTSGGGADSTIVNSDLGSGVRIGP
jgi:hypothetical protein